MTRCWTCLLHGISIRATQILIQVSWQLTDLCSASVNNENFAQAAVRLNLHQDLQHCSGLLLCQLTEYVKSMSESHTDGSLQGPKGPEVSFYAHSPFPSSWCEFWQLPFVSMILSQCFLNICSCVSHLVVEFYIDLLLCGLVAIIFLFMISLFVWPSSFCYRLLEIWWKVLQGQYYLTPSLILMKFGEYISPWYVQLWPLISLNCIHFENWKNHVLLVSIS